MRCRCSRGGIDWLRYQQDVLQRYPNPDDPNTALEANPYLHRSCMCVFSPFYDRVKLIRHVVAITATTWLVVWPAYIVTRMKLSRRVKRILLFSFGSALIFLGLEIFHYVNVINTTYPLLRVTGHIEVRVSSTREGQSAQCSLIL